MIRKLVNLILFAVACAGLFWLWSVYSGKSWYLPDFRLEMGGGTFTRGFGSALCRGWGGC